MKRLRPATLPGPSGFMGDDQSPPPISLSPTCATNLWDVLRHVPQIQPEQQEAILGELTHAIADYVSVWRFDWHSVTPKQVWDYSKKAVVTSDELSSLLSNRTFVEALIATGLIQTKTVAALRAAAPSLKAAALKVTKQVDEPRRGGGTKTQRDRQVRFARQLNDWFAANGWPAGRGNTGDEGSLARVLTICLGECGEPTTKADELLRDAIRKPD